MSLFDAWAVAGNCRAYALTHVAPPLAEPHRSLEWRPGLLICKGILFSYMIVFHAHSF